MYTSISEVGSTLFSIDTTAVKQEVLEVSKYHLENFLGTDIVKKYKRRQKRSFFISRPTSLFLVR